MSTETLLTIAAAAERRDVHHTTIRRWVREGLLPAVRLSDGSLRIDGTDLDAVRQPERVKPCSGAVPATLRAFARVAGGVIEDLGVDGGAHRWRITRGTGAPLVVEQELSATA